MSRIITKMNIVIPINDLNELTFNSYNKIYRFKKIKQTKTHSIYQYNGEISFDNEYLYLENWSLILIVGINDTDKHYNHCLDLLQDDLLKPLSFEKTYSVYIMPRTSAITLYTMKIEPN